MGHIRLKPYYDQPLITETPIVKEELSELAGVKHEAGSGSEKENTEARSEKKRKRTHSTHSTSTKSNELKREHKDKEKRREKEKKKKSSHNNGIKEKTQDTPKKERSDKPDSKITFKVAEPQSFEKLITETA